MDTSTAKFTGIEDEMLELDRQFESTHWAKSTDLKLDLAEIVINGLKSKGWTHEQLAEAIGVEPGCVGRIIHSSQDCSLEMVGKIFHVLGVTGKLSTIKGGWVESLQD